MASESVWSTTLSGLAKALNFESQLDVELTGLTHDSREVKPGDLYIAIPGFQQHGIDFLDQAIAAGAVAVASDEHGCQIAQSQNFPWVLLENPRPDMAAVAAEFFNHPEQKLRIIGVTGTNGKTTVTQMLRTLLANADEKVGVIGTLGAFIGDKKVPTSRTTPESTDLYRLLSQMVAEGVTTVCMEVSSHALVLDRVAGLTFEVAIFTNLTQDHLDFHGSMDQYFAAKELLFTGHRSKTAVVFSDDEWGQKLILSSDAQQIITVGATGDWKISNVSTDLAGHTKFALGGPSCDLKVSVPMFGQFNATNAALCLAVCSTLGLDPKALVQYLESLPQVPGRMQVVSQFNGATAVVDYAHTPDAVEKVLTQLRQAKPAKLITVLGCGGNRDAGKRPVMGKVAAQLSDVLVVTDDNPRFESPEEIRAQIIDGTVGQPAQVIEVGDRRNAIREALQLATEGSVVAVLGKGHELGQEVNGVISDFDDCAVISSEVSCLN
mgnify:CR=1 FL=1